MPRHVIVFARAPALGSGKRRLARDIGDVAALRFERLMLARLLRRLGRQRLAPIAACAVSSARRYRREGYLRRSMRNLLCLSLYFAGVPPRRIARLYG